METFVGREGALMRKQQTNRNSPAHEEAKWVAVGVIKVDAETASNLSADNRLFERKGGYARESGPNSKTTNRIRISFDPDDIKHGHTVDTLRRNDAMLLAERKQQHAEWLRQPGPAIAHRIVGYLQSSDLDTPVKALAEGLSVEELDKIRKALRLEK